MSRKQPTKAEMHRIILKMLDDARLSAMRDDRRAKAEVAASEAGKKVWDEYNPDDGVGGMSGCPFRPENCEERAVAARRHHDIMDEVYRYAIGVFIDGT